MKTLLLAVDGGGSGTRLWALDPAGQVLAEGRGGPSAVMAVGADRAAQSVAEAAQGAGVDARSGRVALVAVTMSGVDREPQNSQIRERVEGLFPGARVVVEHDAVGALLAGTLGEPGVLLLSGTGSISLSRGPGGELVRVGGWGYLVDDVGSGYWLGMEALRRALRGLDGRGPKTALEEALRQRTGVATILDLLGPIHGGEYDRTAVARWASLVLEAADRGDGVAEQILQDGAQELALLVGTVIRRAPWLSGSGADRSEGGGGEPDAEGAPGSVAVVTAGGVFAMGPTWRRRVRDAVGRWAPGARLDVWVRAPLVGAAYVALHNFYVGQGQSLPEEVVANLKGLRAKYSEPF